MDISTKLEYFKIFYQVAVDGNFTKASENLYISQPAISQTIKRLEEELGITLFVRNKRGVTLTNIGKEIFDQVQSALNNFKNVENLVAEQKGLISGKVVIGSSSNISNKLLTLPISNFVKENKNIQILHIKEPQATMFEMLKSGQLDIVITQKNQNVDFAYNPLYKENYLLVKQYGTNENSLDLISINAGSYANIMCAKIIKDKNLNNSQKVVVSSYNLALSLALQGVGIALVPKHLAAKDLKSKKLDIAYPDYILPKIEFGYYYNPALLTPATNAFIKTLNKT